MLASSRSKLARKCASFSIRSPSPGVSLLSSTLKPVMRAWQIDGITGATITSEAIGTILNESANRWAPALVRDADRFTTLDTTGEP